MRGATNAGASGGGGIMSQSTTVTLAANGWMQSTDIYYQTVNAAIVSADTAVVIVDVSLSTNDMEANNNALAAWGMVSAFPVTQGEGTLTFYSVIAPEIDINVNVGVA